MFTRRLVSRWLEQVIRRAANRPPHIVIIGEVYVGKTSTINALFRTELEVRDPTLDLVTGVRLVPSTTQPEEKEVETPHGVILVTDMPGLGENKAKSKQYLEFYRQILPKADVILWILDPDPALQMVQIHLDAVRKLVSKRTFRRIVFCINKVDKIDAGAWIDEINSPDAVRKSAIKTFSRWVATELGLDPDSIVPYSAKRWYNLGQLLSTMLDAIPLEKRLSLVTRANPHSPIEQMRDPHYRQLAQEELAAMDRMADYD